MPVIPIRGAVLAAVLATSFIADARAAQVAVTASARAVERFDFAEFTLRVADPPAGNPFTEAEVAGVFRPADGGAEVRVDGFCDSEDGSVFRVRFMPVRAGRFTGELTYRRAGAETRHAVALNVREGRRRGLVLRDAGHPAHFRWSGTDEPFFYNSTTAYWLLGFTDDAVIRETLDRLDRLEVNRIRVALSGRTQSGMRWKEPMIVGNDDFQFRLEPWPAARPFDIEDPGYDTSRFNLDFFRKAERMLTHARGLDMQVSLIFALDAADRGVDPFGKADMGGPAEQRYYRYCIARFGAYANVWWDLINEWHLCRDEAWVRKMGALVKEWDPCDHTTSVHGTGRFPFGGEPWVDYVMFQSWDEHGAHDFLLRARREQAATGRPLPVVNEEYGYEDHYPFPWGGKRVWPARIAESRVRLAWEMTLAGGHQTTGERANIAGQGGWLTGRGNGEMTLLAGHARLRAFFERFDFRRLEPRPDLVTGESLALPVVEQGAPPAPALCLAEEEVRYVVYLRAGGTATIQLAPGRWRVERFNPRTGASLKLPEARGGGAWTSPALPDTEPWVFLVERDP